MKHAHFDKDKALFINVYIKFYLQLQIRVFWKLSQGCKGDVWLPVTKDSTRDAKSKIMDVSTFEKLYSIETNLTEKKYYGFGIPGLIYVLNDYLTKRNSIFGFTCPFKFRSLDLTQFVMAM